MKQEAEERRKREEEEPGEECNIEIREKCNGRGKNHWWTLKEGHETQWDVQCVLSVQAGSVLADWLRRNGHSLRNLSDVRKRRCWVVKFVEGEQRVKEGKLKPYTDRLLFAAR